MAVWTDILTVGLGNSQSQIHFAIKQGHGVKHANLLTAKFCADGQCVHRRARHSGNVQDILAVAPKIYVSARKGHVLP